MSSPDGAPEYVPRPQPKAPPRAAAPSRGSSGRGAALALAAALLGGGLWLFGRPSSAPTPAVPVPAPALEEPPIRAQPQPRESRPESPAPRAGDLDMAAEPTPEPAPETAPPAVSRPGIVQPEPAAEAAQLRTLGRGSGLVFIKRDYVTGRTRAVFGRSATSSSPGQRPATGVAGTIEAWCPFDGSWVLTNTTPWTLPPVAVSSDGQAWRIGALRPGESVRVMSRKPAGFGRKMPSAFAPRIKLVEE